MSKYTLDPTRLSEYEYNEGDIRIKYIQNDPGEKKLASNIMREGFYKEGKIPTTIRLIDTESSNLRILQQELDLYLEEGGLSNLLYYKGQIMGTQFNVGWRRCADYRVLPISGKELFEAAKVISAKHAKSAHEHAAMWRNFYFFWLYNHAQKLAQEHDKEWTLFTNGYFNYPNLGVPGASKARLSCIPA